MVQSRISTYAAAGCASMCGVNSLNYTTTPSFTAMFIQDLISDIISKDCWDTIIVNGQLDEECIKAVISKLLGYAILGGSVLLKLPQIISILLAKRVDGLSPISFYCELPMSMSLIVYNYLQQNPFSSYGENIFVFVQNLILVLLLWTYMKPAPTLSTMVVMTIGFLLVTAGCIYTPSEYQYILPLSSVPLILSSRCSQVYTNYKNKSTGTLSPITAVLSLAGALARIFTTIQQVGWDYSLLSGFVSTALVTGAMCVQFILYAGNDVSGKKKSKGTKKKSD